MNQKLMLTLAVLAGFACGVLSQYVAPALIVPATPPWKEFASQVGMWKVVNESSIDSVALAKLHPDDYVMRTYSAPQTDETIGVFIAYFKKQRQDVTPDSKALPDGWQSVNSDVTALPVSGQAIPVNVSLLQKQNNQVMVLYWYQQGKDAFAAEPSTNGISRLLSSRTRTDIAMVRVIVPVRESVAAARAVGEDFARNAYPLVLAHTRRTL